MIIVDSNILLRIADPASQQCQVARRAVQRLRTRGENLVIVPQNLYEFWVVATRPRASNGLAMSIERSRLWIGYHCRIFRMLPETDSFLPTWRRLMEAYDVPGLRAHDARFVAAMKVHSIQTLLTFNSGDFKKYPIVLLDPEII